MTVALVGDLDMDRIFFDHGMIAMASGHWEGYFMIPL